jgi:hypothetical protein
MLNAMAHKIRIIIRRIKNILGNTIKNAINMINKKLNKRFFRNKETAECP